MANQSVPALGGIPIRDVRFVTLDARRVQTLGLLELCFKRGLANKRGKPADLECTNEYPSMI